MWIEVSRAREVGIVGALLVASVVGCSGTPEGSPSSIAVDAPATEPIPGDYGDSASSAPQPGVGGGSTPSTSGDPTPCSQIARAACTRLAQCGPGLFPAVWEDDAHCLGAHVERCERVALAAGSSLAAGSAACQTAIERASCADLAEDALSACSAPGALSDGAACGHGSQCKSGFCPRSESGCGVCTARVVAGGACVRGACPTGLACNAAGACVAPVVKGAACNALSPCRATETCSGGVCVAFGAAGAACEAGGLPKCDAALGLFCDPVSNVCRALELAPAGQSCGVSVAGRVTTATSCTGAGQCVGATLAQPGTCVARRRAGEACDATTTGCLTGLECRGGVCAHPDPGACK
ncbi:MAG: hypothetical protein R3B36_00170 [Polyangiaceae bacterium]